MGTIGILHSGSPETAQREIDEITSDLKKRCKELPVIEVDWNSNLVARARSLIQKRVRPLFVRGGSRAAHAAIRARGGAKTPIIVFSNVAPYIMEGGLDLTVTTGVVAHTSDTDADRLELLLNMLQWINPTIGVLLNSNRGDTGEQWKSIFDFAQGRASLVKADVNGPLTIKKAFELFDIEDVDALLVAADPFFDRHRQEVVDRANRANYPAIYQWREFVEAGGLMSFGANRGDTENIVHQMVADIDNGDPVPAVYNVSIKNEFELVVSQSSATRFGRWPLPPAIGTHPRIQVVA